MATKELAKKEETQLPALPDPARLVEIFQSNFEGVQPAFEIVKMPTGGMQVWSVPTEDGEPDIVKELLGIVIDHYAARAYWGKSFGEGGNVPPDCSSLDAKTGSLPRNENGEFGECATCKWAQFGTAVKQDGVKGRGQACQLKHRVFLLVPDRSIFPFLIPLPATSATKKYEGSFSTYVVKLGGKFKKLHEVTTKIKLVKDRNADGIEYAKAQFFAAGDLSEEEKKKVEALRGMLRPAMRSRPFEFEEAEHPEETGNGETDGKDPWDK